MKKILIVDADIELINTLTIQLSQFGYLVEASTTAQEGLEKAVDASLCIVAVELPDQNGFVVCSTLKRDPRTAHIPVIMTSSATSPAAFEQHLELPDHAEGYFLKPINYSALIEDVTNILAVMDARAEIGEQDDEVKALTLDNKHLFEEIPEDDFEEEDLDFDDIADQTPDVPPEAVAAPEEVSVSEEPEVEEELQMDEGEGEPVAQSQAVAPVSAPPTGISNTATPSQPATPSQHPAAISPVAQVPKPAPIGGLPPSPGIGAAKLPMGGPLPKGPIGGRIGGSPLPPQHGLPAGNGMPAMPGAPRTGLPKPGGIGVSPISPSPIGGGVKPTANPLLNAEGGQTPNSTSPLPSSNINGSSRIPNPVSQPASARTAALNPVTDSLPLADDVAELKSQIIALRTEIAQKDEALAALQAKFDTLQNEHAQITAQFDEYTSLEQKKSTQLQQIAEQLLAIANE